MAGTLSTPRSRSLSPWFRHGSLSTLRQEFDDLLGQLWEDGGNGWGAALLAPPLDLTENANELGVRLDLPGLKADDIDIQVNGNQLVVTGERKEEQEEKAETFHRMERRVGKFSRVVTLPCAVQEDKVDAIYADGVLSIKLPKAAEARTKRISVKS